MKSKIIFLFIICFVVGFSLAVQTKVLNGQHLYVSAKVINDLQISIESEIKDTERVKQLVEDTKTQVKEFANLNPVDNSFEQRIGEELLQYKMASGDIDVQGEGVTVSIDDGTRPLYEGEDPNNVLVHDADLLIIINELKTAGAEAISVNGQRIVDSSEIACSGYTVRINKQFFARPFTIKAIGDATRMAAVLVAPEGYGTVLKDYGLTFKVEIKENIVMPGFKEKKDYKYMVKL
jgi:uncharacterized protein YlxW (UPF0749 family)